MHVLTTLHLLLLETVLPEGDVWGHTVLTVVQQDDPTIS